jgi:hypothetical protein
LQVYDAFFRLVVCVVFIDCAQDDSFQSLSDWNYTCIKKWQDFLLTEIDSTTCMFLLEVDKKWGNLSAITKITRYMLALEKVLICRRASE